MPVGSDSAVVNIGHIVECVKPLFAVVTSSLYVTARMRFCRSPYSRRRLLRCGRCILGILTDKPRHIHITGCGGLVKQYAVLVRGTDTTFQQLKGCALDLRRINAKGLVYCRYKFLTQGFNLLSVSPSSILRRTASRPCTASR